MYSEVCYMFSASCITYVTGLGATDTYDIQEMRCCCCSAAGFMYSCVLGDSRGGKPYWTDHVEQRAGERGEKKNVRLFFEERKQCGVFRAPDRLSEAEHNPLTKRASPSTLDAQSTATELGWDPDMHRNILRVPLLAPQPKVRAKTVARRRTPCQKKSVTIT